MHQTQHIWFKNQNNSQYLILIIFIFCINLETFASTIHFPHSQAIVTFHNAKPHPQSLEPDPKQQLINKPQRYGWIKFICMGAHTTKDKKSLDVH